jgi:3-oxoacyl-[acyl-carrier protein] reductase
MEINIKGLKVLVTGASEGLGRDQAIAFSKGGARVAACARSEDRIKALSSELKGEGHLCLCADLSQAEATQNMVKKIMESFGGLDILVNNVGSILKLSTFLDLQDEDWEDSFKINLMPAVRLTRLLLPALKKSSAGRIINISSIAAGRPGEMFPHYSAMKAALSNLSVSLSQTLAADNILVNSISPGPVWSNSWESEAQAASQKSGEDIDDVRQRIQSQTSQSVPLKRMGLPRDITGLVLFLASDHGNWITGTNFTVDGGITQNPY